MLLACLSEPSSVESNRPRDRPMKSTAGFPIALALLVGALLVSCGASGASRKTSGAFHAALKAATCLRAHGVPNYPEPQRINGTIHSAYTTSVNPTTAAVQTAGRKCGAQAELLAEESRSRIVFVRCIRAHGVPRFPYPTAQGRVSAGMVVAQGINPQSPAVARAVRTCLPLWLRPPSSP